MISVLRECTTVPPVNLLLLIPAGSSHLHPVPSRLLGGLLPFQLLLLVFPYHVFHLFVCSCLHFFMMYPLFTSTKSSFSPATQLELPSWGLPMTPSVASWWVLIGCNKLSGSGPIIHTICLPSGHCFSMSLFHSSSSFYNCRHTRWPLVFSVYWLS